MQSKIEGGERLWPTNDSSVMHLFQNKVKFLLKIRINLGIWETNHLPFP